MKNLSILLAVLVLLSLACVAPSYLPTATATKQPTVSAPKPVAISAQPTATVTASDYLRVRDVPMGLRIGYLLHGETVTLTNKCSDEPYPKGWAQIEWEGGVAWVNAAYLSENECR